MISVMGGNPSMRWSRWAGAGMGAPMYSATKHYIMKAGDVSSANCKDFWGFQGIACSSGGNGGVRSEGARRRTAELPEQKPGKRTEKRERDESNWS